MLDWLRHLADDTRAAGFRALRFPGEAMSIFTPIPGVERFAEYESKLNSFLADQRVTVLCLYNHRRLSDRDRAEDPADASAGHLRPQRLPQSLLLAAGKISFRPTGRRARSSGCWRT
jgi:hypothetical protein